MSGEPGLDTLEVVASIVGVVCTAMAFLAVLVDGYGVAVSLFAVAYLALLGSAALRIARVGRDR